MDSIRRVLVLLVLFSTTIPSARAFAAPSPPRDTITGTLFGRVVNDAQEPFPAVRVRVTNLETGNSRASVTDSSGRYRIAFLPLGLYTIEAVKDGFSVSRPTRQPLKVQLNQLVEAVPDIILSPVTLAVAPPPPSPAPIVEASGRLVNRIDPTRRFNLDERQLSNLPLTRIRSFDDLALLAPGVAPPPEVKGVVGPGIGSGIGSAGQFAVNGQRARSNNFTVDGSDNNDEDIGVRRQGFVSLVPQSIESTREVQIVTHLWDAEFGRNLGSQVNAVSRSGGNRIHGGLYDYFSHNALNARDFFDYSSDGQRPSILQATAVDGYDHGQPINPVRIPVMIKTSQSGQGAPVVIQNPSEGENRFQRQQFGASLGFPVRKDKGSVFVSFERQQVIDGEETHFSVPTVAERGFLGRGATGFATADRSGAQRVFNPTFVAGDAVFSLFPFPNNPIGPYGEHTLTQVLQAGGTGTNFSLRLDEMLKSSARGTSHSLSGRYNFTSDERQVPSVGGALFSGVKPKTSTQNISIFLNSQLSARFSNQARLSYGRSRLEFEEIRDPYLTPSKLVPNEPFLLNHGMLLNGSDPRFPPSFVDYFQRPASADSAEDHLGPVGQVIVAPFSPLGVDVDLFPQRRVSNTYQFADTGVYFKGKHNLRFGFDIRRTQLNSAVNREYRAKVSFVGAPDLTTAPLFDGVFQSNRNLLRGLGQFGPTPGFFSGTDLAALGLPTGILQSLSDSPSPDSTIGLRFWQSDAFLTDQWRIRTWFTLSYGLRYQYGTVPHEVSNRIEKTFDTSSLPGADTSLSLCKPFTNCTQPFSNAALLGAYSSTINALQSVLDGRETIYDADKNNFAPHFGFAIDPFAKTKHAGRTVLRGGFSLNFDPVLGNVVSQSRNVYPNFIPINVDANTFSYVGQLFFIPGQTGAFAIYNPKFIPVDVLKNGVTTRYPLIANQELNAMGVTPAAFAQLSGLLFSPPPVALGGLEFPSGSGLAFTLPEKGFRSPYAMQFNLQFEREFASQWLLNVAYVATRGVKLTRFRTPNGGINSLTLPIDPLGLTLTGSGTTTPNAVAIAPLGFQNGRTDFGRLNPSLGSHTLFDSSASSNYHSLQTSITKTYRHGFQVSGTYTWAKAIDDVSDVFDLAGAFALPQDDRDLRAERGLANFDIRHRFVLSLVSELPILRRFDNAQGVAGVLLGGWSVSLISSHQSGQPYTVNSSLDVNLDGNLTDRLDNMNGLVASSDRRVRLQVNPGVNSLNLLAGLGANGSVGRNTFTASGLHETNLSLRKNIRLANDHTLTFRCEAFNLWNRSQFGIPVRILEAPSFGQAVDTRLGARQIQFALKYSF
jgi:hypothetical protein